MSFRRCDAMCHQARRAECNCWCGGRYHGCGSDEARKRFIDDFGIELESSSDFSASTDGNFDWSNATPDDISISPDYRKRL